jgi:hypothetical protein
MLYMLVVCAGHLCMPVDSFGAYTMTLSQCRDRVVEMERLTHAVSLDCYSDDDFDLDVITTGLMLGGDHKRPIMIAPRSD